MGGYIGATAVGLTTTAADVQGDITSTDTTPELILKNTSEEDTEGGREGKITFKGEQSGGEESTLAQIESAHDGTSDDQKGDLIFKTNDGSDGASPTEAMRIDSSQNVGIKESDPQTPLHIRSDLASGYNAALQLDNNDTTVGSEIALLFRSRVGSANTDFSIAGVANAANDMDLKFLSDGNTERMRISADGDVSIGTDSPNSYANYNVLTMDGTNGGVLDLESNGTLTGEIYVGTNQLLIDAVGSSSSLKLQTNSTNALLIDENGHINKPKQSTFFAKKSVAQTNIAVNTLNTIVFPTEIFDQNSDYNTSTSTFTAPVTGRYLITCHILMENIDTAADYYQLRLITSNRIHYSTKDWGGYSSDPAYGVLDVVCVADMDASDTLYAAIYQQNGTAQTDLNVTTCTFSACLLA